MMMSPLTLATPGVQRVDYGAKRIYMHICGDGEIRILNSMIDIIRRIILMTRKIHRAQLRIQLIKREGNTI